MNIDVTALFCCLDDFATLYQTWQKHHLIPTEGKRRRSGKLCLSEMLFIIVLFHFSPFRCFKYFYLYGIGLKHRNCFNSLPHYARFVALMPQLLTPLALISQSLRGRKTGIYFVDSTTLKVCHRRRASRNKVFDGLAKHGRASMGWFFGLKLHMMINHKGQLMAIKITPGNTGDRAALDTLTKHLKGKIYADKGYLGKALFKRLWDKGLQLVTGIRKNMKNYFMPLRDKILLRRRFLIETAFDTLKSHMGLEHTRHRSPINALVHITSCILAHAWKTNKKIFTLAYP